MRTHRKILRNTRIDPNEYETDGDVTVIFLNNRLGNRVGEAIIDTDRLDECLKHRWSLQNFGYVVARVGGKLTLMHRFLFGVPPDGLDTDHINQVRHDNRKENIRHLTRSQNLRNTSARGESGLLGVYRDKRRNNWFAAIQIAGVLKYLGAFATKEEAAAARSKAAKELMALP